MDWWMNSPVSVEVAAISPPLPEVPPDYCSRALALWPRLERGRLARVRHDPRRVAALISRRTNLPRGAILELLGASSDETEAASPQN
jgi:hypothetical protein